MAERSLTDNQILVLSACPFFATGCGFKPQVLASLSGARVGGVSMIEPQIVNGSKMYVLTNYGAQVLAQRTKGDAS